LPSVKIALCEQVVDVDFPHPLTEQHADAGGWVPSVESG
jgi:hypothetical protein